MEIPIDGNFVRICHFWKNRSCTSDRKMSMVKNWKIENWQILEEMSYYGSFTKKKETLQESPKIYSKSQINTIIDKLPKNTIPAINYLHFHFLVFLTLICNICRKPQLFQLLPIYTFHTTSSIY